MTNQEQRPDGIAARNGWLPISEADKDIAYVHVLDGGNMRIGGSYPVWARDEDGRVFEALWSDNGKRAYWWDIEGESPVDPVEFMPHPLDPRFAASPSALEVENKRLREALEPFSKIGRQQIDGPYSDDWPINVSIEIGHIRRARAAFKGGE